MSQSENDAKQTHRIEMCKWLSCFCCDCYAIYDTLYDTKCTWRTL